MNADLMHSKMYPPRWRRASNDGDCTCPPCVRLSDALNRHRDALARVTESRKEVARAAGEVDAVHALDLRSNEAGRNVYVSKKVGGRGADGVPPLCVPPHARDDANPARFRRLSDG
jgi:hypothetical protein